MTVDAIGTDPWLPGVIRNGPLEGLVYEPIVPGEGPKVSPGTMAKLIVSLRGRGPGRDIVLSVEVDGENGREEIHLAGVVADDLAVDAQSAEICGVGRIDGEGQWSKRHQQSELFQALEQWRNAAVFLPSAPFFQMRPDAKIRDPPAGDSPVIGAPVCSIEHERRVMHFSARRCASNDPS